MSDELTRQTGVESSNGRTLHMIGNAHIDPVWLWQWQEGFHEVLATFRSVLDRMQEYDEFRFVSSSAAFYEWVEQTDPEMFAEIRQRVAEGRWEIVGGWWLQPDCNVPCGESFVRQALYGQHYFKQKFGRMARVGYNVDSFGHHAMLPQLLKKSGLDYYVFMRPHPHEKGLPARVFWWEADDGSRVLALRVPYEYRSWGKDLERHVRRCALELKPPLDELPCFYGVGNHGGGPTKENIESIEQLGTEPDVPRLAFSTLNCFFERISSKDVRLPTVHDDLQHHASGCYAAHSAVKRWNRKTEQALVTAETFASVARRVTGQPYPTDFGCAWKNLLFNQFHDILAGTSIEAAYDDACALYGEAMAIADRNLNLALQSLAWNVCIPVEEGVKPIIVFNPHAWAGSMPVELEVRGLTEEHVLVDDEGRTVTSQIVQSHATARGCHRLTFVADLPSLGYRTYRLVPRREAPADTTAVQATDTRLENDRFRLEIDPGTGYLTSLFDKRRELEVLLGPAARPAVMHDPSDTWSHNVLRFDDEVGAFSARSVRLVELGPVKSVIRVVSEYGASRLVQDVTMYAALDRIDVHVTVDWREQFKVLKLQFPVKLYFARATYEIPYGHIERPVNGEEEPGQRWIDVSGVDPDTQQLYGLSLLNDGKYSFDVHNKVMSLTVLRSPIYAHHVPVVPDPEAEYAFIDQGIQRFTYSLLPHDGSWETAGTVKRAAELNRPPLPLLATYRPDGTLPQTDSYLSVDRDNVVVSVVKQAEETDDTIVRCYETAKTATRARIHLPAWNRVIDAEFGPCEIKTFRVPRDAAQPVVETDLLELVE